VRLVRDERFDRLFRHPSSAVHVVDGGTTLAGVVNHPAAPS
jgi:hypothetical protein